MNPKSFFSLSYLSIAMIVVSNCVPLYGVLYLHWDIQNILFLYCAESAIIGVFAIVKLIIISSYLFNLSRGTTISSSYGSTKKIWKFVEMILGLIFLIIFFSFHFGGFVCAHFLALITIFPVESFSDIVDQTFIYSVVSLFISHGVSLLLNFIGQKEYKYGRPIDQMYMPYRRVFVMQITIIFGAVLLVFLGKSEGFIVILVLAKIALDIEGHHRIHKNAIPAPLNNVN